MATRILFLTFYYPPDLCAGSFRASALVSALLKLLPPDVHLEIITTQPNRYESYSDSVNQQVPLDEHHSNYSIHRIALPSHKSGMLDQSKSFLVFSKEVLKRVRRKDYDLVIATSSRLMTASLAAGIAHHKNALLYLDIRDIFVDTIQDLLPEARYAWLTRLFAIVERKTITQAQKVNLVSAGFLPYFQTRYPKQEFTCYTNGIDQEFIIPHQEDVSPPSKDGRPIKILYAGNIGEGQGLHHILPALAHTLKEEIQFIVIGDGGRIDALKTAIKQRSCTNIELRPPMNRAKLLEAYLDADVLFLHMNNFPAFEKVLPSKIFEYAALGKPILAGVAGYSAEFIHQEVTNAQVFSPCDVNSAVRALAQLVLKPTTRAEFIKKFSRTNIMHEMSIDILSLLPADK